MNTLYLMTDERWGSDPQVTADVDAEVEASRDWLTDLARDDARYTESDSSVTLESVVSMLQSEYHDVWQEVDNVDEFESIANGYGMCRFGTESGIRAIATVHILRATIAALLQTSELNADELEPETIAVIEAAKEKNQ